MPRPAVPAVPAVPADPDAPAVRDVGEPRENVVRGLLLCLPLVPVGVVAWLLVASGPFTAVLVAFVVSGAAPVFYRFGSGGLVGRPGVVVVTVVVLVTLVAAVVSGIAVDVATALGYPMPGSLVDPVCWRDVTAHLVENPATWGERAWLFVAALVGGAVGPVSALLARADGAAARTVDDVARPGRG